LKGKTKKEKRQEASNVEINSLKLENLLKTKNLEKFKSVNFRLAKNKSFRYKGGN
jgi:hypothetical protein